METMARDRILIVSIGDFFERGVPSSYSPTLSTAFNPFIHRVQFSANYRTSIEVGVDVCRVVCVVRRVFLLNRAHLDN